MLANYDKIKVKEKFSLLLIFSLFLFGCGKNKPTKNSGVEIILPDTTITHKPNHDYFIVRNLRSELNLKNLELGADSIEIRIYEDGALWSPDRLVIIKNENRIWSSSLVTYWTHLPTHAERQFNSWRSQYNNMIVDSSKTINLTPECSWNNLIDSLQLYKIFTLPPQEEIKRFEDSVTDGVSYNFEIATKKKYKFYAYHCPDIYTDADNQNVTSILKLISRQLTGIIMCKTSGLQEMQLLYRPIRVPVDAN